MSSEQIELNSPPFDSIQCLKFSPTHPDHLLVASWDSTVRFYDVGTNEQKSLFDHRAAVLACSFSSADPTRAFSGGLDTSIRQLNLETEGVESVGMCGDSVSALGWYTDGNALISGSWDRTLRLWDPRAPDAQQSSHALPERVYHMDGAGHKLVVAMASRLVGIYDLRKMGSGEAEVRESSLKYLTRSLGCMADGQGYAMASVEGRIAVEYFDPSPSAQEKKYVFKCHRQTIDEVDHVWAVNALVFHPKYNTFASGGSDGTLSIWDHKTKKRLRQYPKYGNAVSALAFDREGSKIAVGVSYTWDEGEEGARGVEPPRVCVRKVGEEVKPKGWTAG